GLSAWAAQLQGGVSPDVVAQTIVGSTEAHSRLVVSVYQALLGRLPDPSGLENWVRALDSGMTPAQFQAAVAGSTDYALRHLGDAVSGLTSAPGNLGGGTTNTSGEISDPNTSGAGTGSSTAGSSTGSSTVSGSSSTSASDPIKITGISEDRGTSNQ